MDNSPNIVELYHLHPLMRGSISVVVLHDELGIPVYEFTFQKELPLSMTIRVPIDLTDKRYTVQILYNGEKSGGCKVTTELSEAVKCMEIFKSDDGAELTDLHRELIGLPTPIPTPSPTPTPGWWAYFCHCLCLFPR